MLRMPTREIAKFKLLLWWLALVVASPAVATLGQVVTKLPVPVAASAAGVRLHALRPTAYVVKESQLESGTLVREYSDFNGLVFAVDWSGPVIPDLSALLGTYFTVFQADAAQARSEGRYRAPVNVNRSDLVIRSNGRMRNYFGHAYVPSMVPVGVNINELVQ